MPRPRTCSAIPSDGEIQEVINSDEMQPNPRCDDACALNTPRGLAIDVDDNVYIGDLFSQGVYRIEPDGVIRAAFDQIACLPVADFLGNPAVGADGALYIPSLLRQRVIRVVPDGSACGTVSFIDTIPSPLDATTDRAGNVLVSSYAGLYRIEADGRTTRLIPMLLLGAPRPATIGVGSAPDGTVFFTGAERGTVVAYKEPPRDPGWYLILCLKQCRLGDLVMEGPLGIGQICPRKGKNGPIGVCHVNRSGRYPFVACYHPRVRGGGPKAQIGELFCAVSSQGIPKNADIPPHRRFTFGSDR